MAASNGGLRTHYPYGGDALSPRPLYDSFPSPTSNYPSPGIGPGAVSPSFYPMAYQNSPRFGGSVFIPPPDVFVDGRKEFDQENGPYAVKRPMSEINRDPVAMHLLVETAMSDSQRFDVLTVEEVEALKQEQKGLDTRLGTTRRKLESETKIRDAAQSLTRLTSKKDKGHVRGLSSRGSNANRDTLAKSEEELAASNRKVADLTREALEIESRMRYIDTQLLMHTSAVLQMTHHGPRRRKNPQILNENDPRPDSPASIYTYENERSDKAGDDAFDERSLYRSPENLDSLMNALQKGTHHRTESMERQNQTLTTMSKRLENLNERIRELIVEANPERNQQYTRPPSMPIGGTVDASSIYRQMDFLDQGLKSVATEQAEKGASSNSDPEVQERLEGINNQLYAMLSRSDDQVPPPPTVGGVQEQLAYMEDSFYNISQLHYSMNEHIEDLRNNPSGNDDVERYETMLKGLWQTIQTGEEDARERKRERRRLLAEDPDNTEELSPDEDYNVNEQYSLIAFDSKIRLLFRRASSLKDKQVILLRQIKQQRELNNKSDAQREDQVNRLNEQVLTARSEKKTMEGELDRAMGLLRQADESKKEEVTLRNVEARNTTLETELRTTQERATSLESQLAAAQESARAEAEAIQADLAQSAAKIDEATSALHAATAAKNEAEARATSVSSTLQAKEEELETLESEVVRLTTELTFAKAELDGAYGTRAERAAASGAPAKQELEELLSKNEALVAEISALQKLSEAASQSEQEARDSERTLKAELAGMATDYETLTRDAIQNERDRDGLEAAVDKLRDEKEALEMELSDERVKWLGLRSPSVAAGANANAALASPIPPEMGATSIRMLREDFRKMMRERTAEGLRALRTEQEERRKLEAIVRQLRKDAASSSSSTIPAARSNLSAVTPAPSSTAIPSTPPSVKA
ncbi:unnamed protein product [Periconia digitata]|uniref:Up-regulated during septation protein 1 domain-containing protein n=1 Tax=Periconia digitata TaxID=1303443 RepID=A0A9W4XRZ4_9PLEO|nr:unnamed protein product [Periconia digitata]